jgi:hypothetical protein
MVFPYYTRASTASNDIPYVDALLIDHEDMFVASLKTPFGALKITVSPV